MYMNLFRFNETGVFLRESKNRFLCEVMSKGSITECYIPSSCRLDNFLDLSGKEVILSKNKTKNSRTIYRVNAVKHKKSYIILNTSIANELIYNNLNLRRFSFLGPRKEAFKEKILGSYKTDIFIKDKVSGTIIEIKSIISTDNEALFPTVYSKRAIEQLQSIYTLLLQGYSACYFFISLNPYVNRIELNSDIKEYHALLNKCVQLGMVLKGYNCKLKDSELMLTKEIHIKH